VFAVDGGSKTPASIPSYSATDSLLGEYDGIMLVVVEDVARNSRRLHQPSPVIILLVRGVLCRRSRIRVSAVQCRVIWASTRQTCGTCCTTRGLSW
jgi:hypothetical protein